jgi:hypothetical protein
VVENVADFEWTVGGIYMTLKPPANGERWVRATEWMSGRHCRGPTRTDLRDGCKDG